MSFGPSLNDSFLLSCKAMPLAVSCLPSACWKTVLAGSADDAWASRLVSNTCIATDNLSAQTFQQDSHGCACFRLSQLYCEMTVITTMLFACTVVATGGHERYLPADILRRPRLKCFDLDLNLHSRSWVGCSSSSTSRLPISYRAICLLGRAGETPIAI